MKLFNTIFVAGTISLLATSCADESPWSNSDSSGEGSIKIYLSSSGDVSSEIPDTRTVSTDVVVPDVSLFQLRMTNSEGNFVKTWTSLAEFEKDKNFPSDTYSIEAYYGSPSSQGIVKESEVGHEHTYFYGKSENFKVEAGKETNVQIHTQLANSIVIIEYTDAFINYFKDWSTSLATQGEETLTLGKAEGKSYVIPGKVEVLINATLQNGKIINLNPTSFEAQPQHLYKITYNINNGEIGHTEILQIIFNDKIDDEHTIEIDLSDDLLKGDGPVITTVGFQSQETVEALSSSPFDGLIQFNIDSPAGYSEAILTITSENYKPAFLTNGEIDLCQVDMAQRMDLEASGIQVFGLYENPDRLALVDLTNLFRNLPVGEHNITLRVKDKTKYAEASVKLITYPVTLEAQEVEEAIFGRRYAKLRLSYNGTDPTVSNNNPFTFKVNQDGVSKEMKIQSIAKAEDTRAFENKDYIYKIEVPDPNSEVIPVEIYFNNGSSPIKTVNVPVNYPEYKVIYDPFAKRVWLKLTEVYDSEIDFTKTEIQNLFLNRLRVFVDNKENKNKFISSDNIVKVTELSGGVSFNIKTSLSTLQTPQLFENEENLNYEEQAKVPNGDFEETEVTYSETINQGGTWSTSRLDGVNYQNKATFIISEPINWSSSNSKTMGGNNKNTWYYIPSVFNSNLSYTGRCPGVGASTGSQSGTPDSYSGFQTHNGDVAMVIRNVAWDPEGEAIAKDNSQGTTIVGVKQPSSYYNYNVPNISYKSAGKIFLGSYPSSEKIEDSEGFALTSRPNKIIGWYTYDGVNDNGVISILIYSDDTIIVNKKFELQPTSSLSQFSIDLDSYQFDVKATKLAIMITSSKFASSSIEEETKNISVETYLSKIESYQHGATLVIDDLQFVYE